MVTGVPKALQVVVPGQPEPPTTQVWTQVFDELRHTRPPWQSLSNVHAAPRAAAPSSEEHEVYELPSERRPKEQR